MEEIRNGDGRKTGGFLGSSNRETNPGWGAGSSHGLVLLSQVTLGKPLSLWALVSPSENGSGEAANATGSL